MEGNMESIILMVDKILKNKREDHSLEKIGY